MKIYNYQIKVLWSILIHFMILKMKMMMMTMNIIMIVAILTLMKITQFKQGIRKKVIIKKKLYKVE